MSQETIQALQTDLKTAQRKLDIIMAIDRIRDTISEPVAMMSAIVTTLTEMIPADLCLLCLLNQETQEVELKAFDDRTQSPTQLWSIIPPNLAEKAIHLDKITIWSADKLSEANLSTELELAAVPIIINDTQRLGALILARTNASFNEHDIELLRAAESQVDSAIIQGYVHHELRQYVKELETIYRIDSIRDQSLPLDKMMNKALEEVCTVIEAEIGFVMLYNHVGQQLELRASTHDNLFRIARHYKAVEAVAYQSLQEGHLICQNQFNQQSLRSLLCMPLILKERIIGVLGVINSHRGNGFNQDDQRLLKAIGSQMDIAIFDSLEKRHLREVLGRAVDPRVMKRLLANPGLNFLKGERVFLTVLYVDIRGSTQLAEQTEPEMLVGFINHYLSQMTDIIFAHEGTLDKFVGDEVMALFGAPFTQEDHALRAVKTGLAMQKAHQTVMEIWWDRGVQAMPIGVGISSGEMIVGEMGGSRRANYTVIGKAANLGSRICDVAPPGQVLISAETYRLVKDVVKAVPLGGYQFKGIGDKITVYRVLELLED